MKRCVIASKHPAPLIEKYHLDYSIMVVNPDAPPNRYRYLIEHSDYSLLVTDQGNQERDGNNYDNERAYWYTSGTTGDSKFVSFTWKQINHVAKTIQETYNLSANDRYYGIMPLWHSHGQGLFWAMRRAGVDCQWGTFKDKDKIEQFQPTVISAIPQMVHALTRYNLQELRFVRTASTQLQDRTHRQLQAHWNVPIIEAFGMTEMFSHCFTNPLYGEQKIGTIGKPSGALARVDDDGHLWLRGYFGIGGGWFDTGDLAEQDSDGYYSIRGRSIDQINVHGLKINPVSLETQLLDKFSSIEQVVVYGNNGVKCMYVGDTSEKDVYKFLCNLAPHCRPVQLHNVKEIPVNDTGKISRTWLNSQNFKHLQI